MCKMAAIRIGKVIKRELKQTCKTKEHSVFKDKSLEALEKFNWSDTVADLQRTAPILTTMLHNCINAVSKDVTISVVAGVLLQAYSEEPVSFNVFFLSSFIPVILRNRFVVYIIILIISH